jgi:hypothetical protein
MVRLNVAGKGDAPGITVLGQDGRSSVTGPGQQPPKSLISPPPLAVATNWNRPSRGVAGPASKRSDGKGARYQALGAPGIGLLTLRR